MATPSLVKNVKHTMFTTPESTRRPLHETYEVGREIGKGSYGNVFRATHKHTGLVCAVKVIQKDKADKRFNRFVDNELEILKFVKHRHIVALLEIMETPDNFYLVTELCDGGELETKIYPEEEVKIIISRLVDVVQYLHTNNLVHRDIKPENILLAKNTDDQFDIRLGDFGLSCYKGTEDMLLDSCGTPLYMAPEVLKNLAYSDKCDIWSIGVIMYQLLTGVDSMVLNSMLQDDWLDYELLTNSSKEAQNLLKRMLTHNPANRDSASEVLHNPWITGDSYNGEVRMNVLELMEQMNTENTQTVKKDNEPIKVKPQIISKQTSFLLKSHHTTRPASVHPPMRKTSHQVRMRTSMTTDKYDPRRLTNPEILNRPTTSLSPSRHQTGGIPSYMQDTKSSRIAKETTDSREILTLNSWTMDMLSLFNTNEVTMITGTYHLTKAR
ncbi:Serine/threonine-protein kinase 33-like [Oopsacas minuta]|uniref:Serine/threonine-protein kinase 33-like n=1 Tax=Oopsacas minuta TaxID=111878 RepID=A0AAV7KA62_9METZ|nr:Serine/threonine-protein kinase 33-like [Oopsacas minuta]